MYVCPLIWLAWHLAFFKRNGKGFELLSKEIFEWLRPEQNISSFSGLLLEVCVKCGEVQCRPASCSEGVFLVWLSRLWKNLALESFYTSSEEFSMFQRNLKYGNAWKMDLQKILPRNLWKLECWFCAQLQAFCLRDSDDLKPCFGSAHCGNRISNASAVEFPVQCTENVLMRKEKHVWY